jgi:hypothetical protein
MGCGLTVSVVDFWVGGERSMLDRPGAVGATQHGGVKPFAEVLHGRERELAAAVGVAHTACTSGGGVLLITGDAGIGKTALLTEVFRRTAGHA